MRETEISRVCETFLRRSETCNTTVLLVLPHISMFFDSRFFFHIPSVIPGLNNSMLQLIQEIILFSEKRF